MARAKAPIVYTRNWAGYWRRNGKSVKSVPDAIERMAARMDRECSITVTPERVMARSKRGGVS